VFVSKSRAAADARDRVIAAFACAVWARWTKKQGGDFSTAAHSELFDWKF
jgi:hypothetical protein